MGASWAIDVMGMLKMVNVRGFRYPVNVQLLDTSSTFLRP